MTATTIHFNLTFVLLWLAVILFVWASLSFLKPRAWVVPLGLACFAGAFLAERFS